MSDVALFAGDRFYRSQFGTGQASYTIFQKDGVTYADPGYPGGIPYSGTDPTTVIQNALTALTGGGIVLVKNGRYLLTTAITVSNNGVQLVGENRWLTILQATGNFNILNVSGHTFVLDNIGFETTTVQTSGIALNLTGTEYVISRIRLGIFSNGRQYFYQGIVCNTTGNIYGVIRDVFISDCVNACIIVSGGGNDLRLSDITIPCDTFANNPVGISIQNTTGLFLNQITVSGCDPGMNIVPGNAQSVFESFFTDINLDSNNGAGLVCAPTGSGLVHDIHFKNMWASTNWRKASPPEDGSVHISNCRGLEWHGGTIGNNPWEGLIVDGTTDMDIDGVRIVDNNQGNHTGTQGSFGGAPTAGVAVNGANVRFRMIGAACDNPGIGTPAGHQGGVYILNSASTILTGVSFANAVSPNQIGLASNPGNVLITKCPGYTPLGVATISVTASPFTYTNNDGLSEYITIDGGTVTTVVKNGITLYSFGGAAARCAVWLEPAETVTVTYTVAPTMNKDRK